MSNDNNKQKIFNLILNASRKLLGFLAKMLLSIGLVQLPAALASIAAGTALPIAIAGGLIVSTGVLIKSLLTPIVTVNQSASFIGTFPTDNLFTSYAIIPVILLEGQDKRDYKVKQNRDIDLNNDDVKSYVFKGYCRAKYQVAFGYNNVQSILTDETNKSNACAGDFDKLPGPSILSKLEIEDAKANGSYKQSDCDSFFQDNADDGIPKVDHYIADALAIQTESIYSVIDRSKKSLGTFLKINCQN